MHAGTRAGEPVGRSADPARARQTLASAEPRHLDRGPRHARRAPAPGQRRSRGHAFLGGSAVSVSGRGGLRLPRPAAIRGGSCAVSATSICCVCSPSAGCRRRFTERRKVIFRAPLDSFHMDPEPPFVGQLLERGIVAPHGLFRRRRGASLAARFSPDARRARCRVSPSRAASPPWWRRSSGTTSTLTRTSPNCRRASAACFSAASPGSAARAPWSPDRPFPCRASRAPW